MRSKYSTSTNLMISLDTYALCNARAEAWSIGNHGMTKQIEFFIHDGFAANVSIGALPTSLEMHVFSPSLNKLCLSRHGSLPIYLFWYMCSSRRYQVYYVFDNDEVVHFSHVLWKNPKFTFMNWDDIEIGPCWTSLEYRGQGICTFVLRKIVRDYQNKANHIYMFTDSHNTASKRSILKAGFRHIGNGTKSRLIGRYRITKSKR